MDFFRLVQHAEADVVNTTRQDNAYVGKDPAIRLLHYTDAEWILQVRGPRQIAKGTSKEFVIAGAYLNKQDLLALRHAIDEALERT